MTKLPVWTMVRESYAIVFQQYGSIALLFRNWAIAAGLAYAVVYALINAARIGDPSIDAQFGQMPAAERALQYAVLSMMIFALSFGVVVVRWHRMLLLGQSPRETRRSAFWVSILYGAKAGMLVMIFMLCVALLGLWPATFLRGVAIPAEISLAIRIALVTVSIVLGLTVIARLSLLLPACAVGIQGFGFAQSWAATRHNGARLLLGTVAASGPAVMTNVVVNGIFDNAHSFSGDIVSVTIILIVSLLLSFVAGIIQVTFLSKACLLLVMSGKPLP